MLFRSKGGHCGHSGLLTGAAVRRFPLFLPSPGLYHQSGTCHRPECLPRADDHRPACPCGPDQFVLPEKSLCRLYLLTRLFRSFSVGQYEYRSRMCRGNCKGRNGQPHNSFGGARSIILPFTECIDHILISPLIKQRKSSDILLQLSTADNEG